MFVCSFVEGPHSVVTFLALELLDSKGSCSVWSSDDLQCGEQRSPLGASSRLGAPLRWEMKLSRLGAGLTLTLFLGHFFVLRSPANDFGRDPDTFLYFLNTFLLAEFRFPTPSECRGKERSFNKVFGGREEGETF